MVDYKGLVRAVTSGATTTIRGIGHKLSSLDTMSMLATTTLIQILRLEHSMQTEFP